MWLYSNFFVGCCFQYFFKTETFLCSYHLAFFQCFVSVHVVVWTRLRLERNPVLFYRNEQTFRQSVGVVEYTEYTFAEE